MMRKMLILASISLLCMTTTFVFAKPMSRSRLNRVMFQVAAQKWVKTSTAKVVVAINATLDKSGLAKARENIKNNLTKIAKGEWNITAFDRSQDNSGLERLSVQAQARLSQDQLANLRQAAKAVSKPGATYRIAAIDFQPSLADVQTVRSELRNTLYAKINHELQQLNKAFPEQHYSVFSINFLPIQMTSPALGQRRYGFNLMKTPAVASSSLMVSNKVNLTATVMLAANRVLPPPPAKK